MPRAKSDAGGSDGEKLDFEASMKRLETIVEELESGELSLEDSIARYEEGMKLSKGLTEKLEGTPVMLLTSLGRFEPVVQLPK